MMYGKLVADGVVVLTDADHGKPVVESEAPSHVPDGYVAKGVWVETDSQLMLVYDVLPAEGTPQEAALALSRLQFKSLPDEAAYQFRALADAWVAGASYHGPSDASGAPQSRVIYEGQLYRCLKTHAAQDGWKPTAAPSLWAKILPGQSGSGTDVGEWVRPDSTNGYSTGDRVTHNGRLWESIVNDNVDEPGTDNGFRWRDLGEVGA